MTVVRHDGADIAPALGRQPDREVRPARLADDAHRPAAGLRVAQQGLERGLDVVFSFGQVAVRPALDHVGGQPVGGHYQKAVPGQVTDVLAVDILVTALGVDVEHRRPGPGAGRSRNLDRHVD